MATEPGQRYKSVQVPYYSSEEWARAAHRWGWPLSKFIFFACEAFIRALPENPMEFRPKVRDDILSKPPSLAELEEWAEEARRKNLERLDDE